MTDINRSFGARADHQLKPGADGDEIKRQRPGFGDVEFGEASIELRQARTAYHVALTTLARSNLPSLTDFLG